jgi:uncharacterized membrane protein required for colicin V production
MWFILDLIIIAIIAIFVFTSAKRGFVRTVVELVGYFLAIYIAFTAGGILAESIYDFAIEPKIVESVADKISVSSETSTNEIVDEVWNSLPDFVVDTAENFNITSHTLKTTLEENVNNHSSSAKIAQNASTAIVRPIAVPLIKTILSIILFVVLMFFVRILARIINKAFSLPLIGSLNRTLGGVIGLLKGLIFAFVFVISILFIMSFFENGFLIFTNENIEKTYLFKFLAEFSPFK